MVNLTKKVKIMQLKIKKIKQNALRNSILFSNTDLS